MIRMFERTMLSILAMYKYDPAIFDEMSLPEGVDKQNVIDNILLSCAELSIIYPDPDILKYAIRNWSTIELPVWQKLYDTTTFEYNPIWNVDADITRTTDRNIDRAGDNENIASVKGYNSNSWSEADKTDGDYSDNTKEATTETEKRHGNIGVTATQDLIQKERDIAEFNIYDHITQSFKKRFCILVY